jgi:hypothetical protein
MQFNIGEGRPCINRHWPLPGQMEKQREKERAFLFQICLGGKYLGIPWAKMMDNSACTLRLILRYPNLTYKVGLLEEEYN